MKCSQDRCEQQAVLAIRTSGTESVRGIRSEVYYEPDKAPKGSDPKCAAHGVALVEGLIAVLS